MNLGVSVTPTEVLFAVSSPAQGSLATTLVLVTVCGLYSSMMFGARRAC
jgi:hypothetical protein